MSDDLPSTLAGRLDVIRAHADLDGPRFNPNFTCDAHVPRLLKAVEAALKLHQPVTTNGGWLEGREWQECGECGPNNGCEHVIASPGRGESFWPCPTVEAITAALGGTPEVPLKAEEDGGS